MATAVSSKAKCVTCGKEKSTYYCRGCSKDFCFNHLTEHRQIVGKQLDDIQNIYNEFRQTLIEQQEDPNRHILLQQISKWEEDSIVKIQQTANACKQILTKHINHNIIEIENKLIKLSDLLKQTQQEDEFNEVDLNQLESMLTKLRIQFLEPPNVSIHQDSTSFIEKISVIVSSGEYINYKR